MLQIMLHTDGFVAEILADIGHFSVLQIVLQTDGFVGVISFFIVQISARQFLLHTDGLAVGGFCFADIRLLSGSQILLPTAGFVCAVCDITLLEFHRHTDKLTD